LDSLDPRFIKADVERRQYRRVKLVIKIHCEALNRHDVLETRNVSIGGMFINVRSPMPVNSELSLTFQLWPAEPAITCRARVMFSRLGLGMGIQFLDLSGAAQKMLQRFVDEVA
jgi:c-di-GMP-binding flagellar brake protein YcgR